MKAALLSMSLVLVACDEPATTASPPPAASPTQAAAASAKPKTPAVTGEVVKYRAGETELHGYLAYDPAIEGERPGVLVVHEWWGHNDYVRKRAIMLARLGYTAFALDMYGEGKNTDHPKDAEKFMKEVVGNMEAAVARFDAAKKLLEEHASTDAKKTAAVGYCFGGAVALHMARIGSDLDGVASFHGNLATERPAERGAVKAKLLVLHGEVDPMVPPEQVAAFKEEMQDAGADLRFVGYPNAKHAFTNSAATEIGNKHGIGLAYDEAADKRSWKELESFLKTIFAD